MVFLLHVVWSSQYRHPLFFPLTTAAGSPGWLNPGLPCGRPSAPWTWSITCHLPAHPVLSSPTYLKFFLQILSLLVLPGWPLDSDSQICIWGRVSFSWRAETMAAFPKETLSKGPRIAKDIFSLSKILKHWLTTCWEIVTLWLLKHRDAFSLNFVETLSHKNPKTYYYSVLCDGS